MDESQTWNIAYYENANGSSPALEFIKSLQKRDQCAILRALEHLENGTPPRSMVSRIESTKLWELRVFATNSCRLIFFYEDRHIVILHGFLKKTNGGIPPRFIRLAQQRYKDYLLSV
ncbi:type II toxin-antitoxin system RelE/ParE family toxin [Ktedonobacter racemifer]|uniref:Type II toxin-antitoxin system RelE/ParE family toxin n=1 Tax=Ktedonobacter racemifer DSM 44963 TaxID=485913 RepID=D6TKV0_KTERA|nr:protein of unknown function DUF891 [Ktedonobacter racemifer DSM 44963]